MIEITNTFSFKSLPIYSNGAKDNKPVMDDVDYALYLSVSSLNCWQSRYTKFLLLPHS